MRVSLHTLTGLAGLALSRLSNDDDRLQDRLGDLQRRIAWSS